MFLGPLYFLECTRLNILSPSGQIDVIMFILSMDNDYLVYKGVWMYE